MTMKNIATAENGQPTAPDLHILERLCRKHNLGPVHQAVVPEAYMPFVPANWNRILVTAEAQNLSATFREYREWLLKQGRSKRIRRLYALERIAIAPWSDGTLPLAIESALRAQATQTAVSNAVPWSLVSDSGINANPSSELIASACDFWRDVLPVLNPRILVVCGSIGRAVFNKDVMTAAPAVKAHYVRLPSSSLLSRVAGMFAEDDLLARYPEVARVAKRRPDFVTSYRKNKIFFACHVVSLVKGPPS